MRLMPVRTLRAVVLTLFTALYFWILAFPAFAIEIGEANIVKGDCADRAKRVAETGVKTPSGDHPGKSGWTDYFINLRSIDSQVSIKQRPNGKVCALVSPKLQFDVKVVETRLDWQPGDPFGACAPSAQDWHTEIENHEAGHAIDYQRISEAFNQNAQVRNYRACGRNARVARRRLARLIQPDVDVEFADLKKQLDDSTDAYHQANGDAAPIPACCRLKTYCPCKSRDYPTEELCLIGCSSGLGCFGQQCTLPPS